MITKKILLLILIVVSAKFAAFSQAKCYDEYTGKFKTNGAQAVTDGMQNVVVAVKDADGNSSCAKGEIMVKKGAIVLPLYLERENGTHSVVYGKLDQNFYRQAETKINYSIDMGMTAVFMLTYKRQARLFFTDFLNPDPGAVVKAPELKKSEAVESTDLEKISVSAKSIEFETGKADIKQESFQMLDVLAELMKHYPNAYWAIDGYTDNVGDAQSNMTLSEDRAQAVADYFVKQGVKAGNLFVNGYGQDLPIADNSTEAGRKQNRRVEIKPIQ